MHCVQKRAIVIKEGIKAHAFEDSEENDERVEVAVKYNDLDTPIHSTT